MGLLFSSKIENPDEVFFEGEDEGEEVLLTLRKHPITNLKWLLIFLFLLILPIPIEAALKETVLDYIPIKFQLVTVVFWYIFAFGYFLTSYLVWFYSVYIVTNRRIVDIDFHDFLYKRFSEAPIRNIEDITHSYVGVLQPIFDYATIQIQTAAESKEIEFEMIPDPANVQDFISDLVAKEHYGQDLKTESDYGSNYEDGVEIEIEESE